MRRGVVLLVGGEREVELVRAIDAPGTGLTVTRRCADTAELLAAVAAGVAQVAVVDTGVHGVDLGLIARAEEAGVRTIVLTGAEETSWRRASAQVPAQTPIGRVLHAITAAIAQPAQVGGGESAPPPPEPIEADGEEESFTVTQSDAGGVGSGGTGVGGGGGAAGGGAAGGRGSGTGGGGSNGGSGSDGGGGSNGGGGDGPPPEEPEEEDALTAWLARGEDPAGAMAALLMPTDEQEEEEPARLPGRVITVWGTPGAPGRTTIAANLAVELAALATPSRRSSRRGDAAAGDARPRSLTRRRRDPEPPRGDGRPVLLIDGDTEAPCLAQVLGLLEESSALAALARRASHGRLNSAGLLRTSAPIQPGLHVASGLSRADRWREVPASALQEVLRIARSAAQLTVLDLGAGAEEPPPGLDAWGAPPRHGVTRAALAEADVVLVVGAADPVGVRRLVGALTTLRDQSLAPAAQVFPVVTKLRASAVGADPAQSVLAVLDAYADVSQAIVIPDDRAAFDECLLRGRLLAEVAPKSAARTPLVEFARWLLPAPGAPVAA